MLLSIILFNPLNLFAQVEKEDLFYPSGNPYSVFRNLSYVEYLNQGLTPPVPPFEATDINREPFLFFQRGIKQELVFSTLKGTELLEITTGIMKKGSIDASLTEKDKIVQTAIVIKSYELMDPNEDPEIITFLGTENVYLSLIDELLNLSEKKYDDNINDIILDRSGSFIEKALNRMNKDLSSHKNIVRLIEMYKITKKSSKLQTLRLASIKQAASLLNPPTTVAEFIIAGLAEDRIALARDYVSKAASIATNIEDSSLLSVVNKELKERPLRAFKERILNYWEKDNIESALKYAVDFLKGSIAKKEDLSIILGTPENEFEDSLSKVAKDFLEDVYDQKLSMSIKNYLGRLGLMVICNNDHIDGNFSISDFFINTAYLGSFTDLGLTEGSFYLQSNNKGLEHKAITKGLEQFKLISKSLTIK